jgi:Ankyrin repeat
VRIGWRKFSAYTLALVGAAALYCLYDAFHWPLNVVTTYAVSKYFPPWERSLAAFRIRQVSTCRSEDFVPSTPLSFLVATMDDTGVDLERSRALFRHFQAVGCDVNAANGGLRPLHEAILYRNAESVSFLLERGADPSLKLTDPSKHAGLDSYEWADWVCSKPGRNCDHLQHVLQATMSNNRIERPREP